LGRLIGVFGVAGFGREVMLLLRQQLLQTSGDDEVVFIEPISGQAVIGTTVIAQSDFLYSTRSRAFIIAIADGSVRKNLYRLSLASGAEPLDVKASSAEILGDVTLGAGAILCGHSSITDNTRVGLGFHLNISSYLAHDCSVGDFVTFGPNVVCAGNVVIEDGAYIGAGALIRQGTPEQPIRIGAGAVVGMGAVVTGCVPAGATVIGNPARILAKG
jgi:sugar O-acyltransferase (sialic acid O-acetyltransferase NeuD family)